MLDFGRPNAFGQQQGGAHGSNGRDPAVRAIQGANVFGGKAIIKFNPTSDEIVLGIRPQVSLLAWQSPTGEPQWVTIEVGRFANGLGGPGQDHASSNGASTTGIGGGTYPLGQIPVQNGNFLSYRGAAQITLGTPGTMQDIFFLDINRGQRFTALASYVDVTALMQAPSKNLLFGIPFESGSMGVYATLGVDLAPSLTPVFFTQFVDETPGATGFVQIVPPRANILAALLTNTGTVSSPLQIKFFDNPGQPISTFLFNSSTIPQPIVIPQDIYSIRVDFNPQASTAAFDWRLVYQLSV